MPAKQPHNNYLDFLFLEGRILKLTGYSNKYAIAFTLGLPNNEYDVIRAAAENGKEPPVQLLKHMELMLQSEMIRAEVLKRGHEYRAYFGLCVEKYNQARLEDVSEKLDKEMNVNHPNFPVFFANHAHLLSEHGKQWEVNYGFALIPYMLNVPASVSGLPIDTTLTIELVDYDNEIPSIEVYELRGERNDFDVSKAAMDKIKAFASSCIYVFDEQKKLEFIKKVGG